jgi:hypothetical protein
VDERTVPVYRMVEVEQPTDLQLAVRRRWRQTFVSED